MHIGRAHIHTHIHAYSACMIGRTHTHLHPYTYTQGHKRTHMHTHMRHEVFIRHAHTGVYWSQAFHQHTQSHTLAIIRIHECRPAGVYTHHTSHTRRCRTIPSDTIPFSACHTIREHIHTHNGIKHTYNHTCIHAACATHAYNMSVQCRPTT